MGGLLHSFGELGQCIPDGIPGRQALQSNDGLERLNGIDRDVFLLERHRPLFPRLGKFAFSVGFDGRTAKGPLVPNHFPTNLPGGRKLNNPLTGQFQPLGGLRHAHTDPAFHAVILPENMGKAIFFIFVAVFWLTSFST